MPRRLLPEGPTSLSPESVSCGAKTNQNLEGGLGRDRKGLERGQCVWCVRGTVTEDW